MVRAGDRIREVYWFLSANQARFRIATGTAGRRRSKTSAAMPRPSRSPAPSGFAPGPIWRRSTACGTRPVSPRPPARTLAPTPSRRRSRFRSISGLDAGNASTRTFHGWWVVTRLTERHRQLRVDGIPARIDFTASLTEHADRPAGADGVSVELAEVGAGARARGLPVTYPGQDEALAAGPPCTRSASPRRSPPRRNSCSRSRSPLAAFPPLTISEIEHHVGGRAATSILSGRPRNAYPA